MITTRRGFIKRAGGTLVALGVGIKPKLNTDNDLMLALKDPTDARMGGNGSPRLMDNFGVSESSLKRCGQYPGDYNVVLTKDPITNLFSEQGRSPISKAATGGSVAI